ncbi:MAG TPA: sigma-70 family RNA polymerase sigma factor [Actinomycetales bacterium]|nr:sigma-70 family RNA polymerase sigma factor [Actinomycetales bacterium]
MVPDPVPSDVRASGVSGSVAQAAPPLRDPEADVVAALVAEAAAGSQQAWDGIVARYNRLVWAVARSFRLTEPDAADVVQTTWLRLVEHLDGLQQPERVGAWLGTTARREALRLAKVRGQAVQRSSDADLVLLPDAAPSIEESLLTRERDAQLYRAVLQLNDRCQRLLRVLSASPPPRYETVSEALGLPVGSIGPTRGRCLDKLRKVLDEQGWFGETTTIETGI